MENVSNAEHTPAYQTNPLHQYSTVQDSQTIPHQYPVTYPLKTSSQSSVVNAGLFGLIVVSTGVMGANLNKVTKGQMTLGQATSDSLVKGAIGGAAAASATAASTSLTNGGVAGLAVTVAAATGVSYLINKVIS